MFRLYFKYFILDYSCMCRCHTSKYLEKLLSAKYLLDPNISFISWLLFFNFIFSNITISMTETFNISLLHAFITILWTVSGEQWKCHKNQNTIKNHIHGKGQKFNRINRFCWCDYTTYLNVPSYNYYVGTNKFGIQAPLPCQISPLFPHLFPTGSDIFPTIYMCAN